MGEGQKDKKNSRVSPLSRSLDLPVKKMYRKGGETGKVLMICISYPKVIGGEFRIRERPVAQGVLRPVAREYETRLRFHTFSINSVDIVLFV